jgi:hypothetical protein
MPTGSCETLTRRFLSAVFAALHWHGGTRHRPQWLRRTTGSDLEFDIYEPSCLLAI